MSNTVDTRRKNVETFCKEHNCTLVSDLRRKFGQGWEKRVEGLHYLRTKKNVFVLNSDIDKIIKYVNEGSHIGKTEYKKIEKFEIENDCTHLQKLKTKYGKSLVSIIDSLDTLRLGKYIFIKNTSIPKLIEYFNTSKGTHISVSRNYIISQFEKDNNCILLKTIYDKYGLRIKPILNELDIITTSFGKFVPINKLQYIKSYIDKYEQVSTAERSNITKNKTISLFETTHNCVLINKLVKKYGKRWLDILDNYEVLTNDSNFHFVSKAIIPQIENYISELNKYGSKQNYKIHLFEIENDCTCRETLLKKYCLQWENILTDDDVLRFGRFVFYKNSAIPRIEKYSSEGNHNPQSVSSYEFEIEKFIKEHYTGEVIHSCRSIIKNENNNFAELDIYIPDKKVAIEFNGAWWHSINAGTDRNYHLYKTEECLKQGIRLLHIFEWQWVLNKDICKSIILSALGIYTYKYYGRKCSIKEISSNEYKTFLDTNHISGSVNSSIRVGLFFNNKLVQVVGFGKSRFKSGEYELHRMCNKLNTQVIGGFSKLIKYVCNKYNITEFVSFVDRSLYNGNGYLKIGFEQISVTKPSYVYLKGLQVFNRIGFQKHKLKNKLEKFDNTLSEQENMINNKYNIVYDCGNLKMKYSIS